MKAKNVNQTRKTRLAPYLYRDWIVHHYIEGAEQFIELLNRDRFFLNKPLFFPNYDVYHVR